MALDFEDERQYPLLESRNHAGVRRARDGMYMREERLRTYVQRLVTQTWTDDDADVALVVTEDEAFGTLAYWLGQYGGDVEGIRRVWAELDDELDDSDLDFLVDKAEHPAAVLCSKLRGLHGE